MVLAASSWSTTPTSSATGQFPHSAPSSAAVTSGWESMVCATGTASSAATPPSATVPSTA